MFKFSELEQVNVEITNRCQAECPMCPRNIHGGIENPLLKIYDWTIDDFKAVFDYETVRQIKIFTICGNFGDPVLNNDLVKMCEYIKTENPTATVTIHTNGSLRTTKWWSELVSALPVKHSVVFALDGMADTHHLYRVNTFFDKIVENAKAFIDAGGQAVWHYIRFKHNEHQVDEARQLAKNLGFRDFMVKNTRRFTSPSFKVVDKTGKVTHLLEPTTDSVIEIVDKKVLEERYPIWSKSNDIYCFVQDEKNLYIDVNFTVTPCCIFASWLHTSYDIDILKKYDLYDEDRAVDLMGDRIKKQVYEILDELGGFDALDAKAVGIKNIINTEQWQTIWYEKWRTNGAMPCMLMCSKDSPFIPLKSQFIEK